MSSAESHWINGPLTAEQKVEFYEQEIELARDFAKQEARKELIKKLSDARVGSYIGEGLFKLADGNEIEL
jgi:hypothetical protein